MGCEMAGMGDPWREGCGVCVTKTAAVGPCICRQHHIHGCPGRPYGRRPGGGGGRMGGGGGYVLATTYCAVCKPHPHTHPPPHHQPNHSLVLYLHRVSEAVAYIHTCSIHTYLHTYTYIHTYTHIHTYTYIHTYILIHTYM